MNSAVDTYPGNKSSRCSASEGGRRRDDVIAAANARSGRQRIDAAAAAPQLSVCIPVAREIDFYCAQAPQLQPTLIITLNVV